MKKLYRNQIIETINKLIETREIIFTQIINIAMSTEYELLDTTFDEDDVFEFSLRQFEKMEDSNIQKLVEHCIKTEQIICTIMDLNGIKETEVNLNEE